MSFKVNRSASYKWEVKIEYPVDGGKYESDLIDIIFKRPSQVDSDLILERIQNDSIKDDDLLNEYVLGWGRVKDELGELVPFSREVFNEYLREVNGARKAIALAFIDSMMGVKRKN